MRSCVHELVSKTFYLHKINSYNLIWFQLKTKNKKVVFQRVTHYICYLSINFVVLSDIILILPLLSISGEHFSERFEEKNELS